MFPQEHYFIKVIPKANAFDFFSGTLFWLPSRCVSFIDVFARFLSKGGHLIILQD